MKIPEDYTIEGSVFGSIHHIKNNISGKTRSNNMNVEIKGSEHSFQWQSIETPNLHI